MRSDHVGLLINNTTCPARHAAAATVQLLRSAGRNACGSLQASLCALFMHDISDWLLCELVHLHVAQWRLQQARRDTLHATSRSESRLVRTGAAQAVNIGKLPFLGHSKAQTRDEPPQCAGGVMPRRKLTETVCAAISSGNTGNLPASYSTQTTICNRCKLQIYICMFV